MPAVLDDPNSPTIYRTSGASPYPDPHDPHPPLPLDVYPRQVTLRDRVTVATIVPFSSQHQVPSSLLAYLSDQLNKEIEMGDTYPMLETIPTEKFSSYWFQNFGAVMLLGHIESADELIEDKHWERECLGSFYIKPNYPGRSSHVCNAGFLVTEAARNRGVGRLMGESYLDWAPRLGYTYSVFNLVYETNVASCKIWDALGFKRIGRVKGAGNLKSYPGEFIDALIYGRDLGPEGADFVSEERFDKIKFYLKWAKYPAGADRAEKSRLRSAATHYKLLDNDKLMLKDKEVISDPQKQYEIARQAHLLHHGGINKTTAKIAEKHHWIRIKETVSLVIRNCAECKELGKTAPVLGKDGIAMVTSSRRSSERNQTLSAAGRILSLPSASSLPPHSHHDHDISSAYEHTHHPSHRHEHHSTSVSPQVLHKSLPDSPLPSAARNPLSNARKKHHLNHSHSLQRPSPPPPQRPSPIEQYLPLDPQIMEDVRQHLGSYNSANNHTTSHTTNPSHSSLHTNNHSAADTNPTFTHHDDAFQSMLVEEEGDADHEHDEALHRQHHSVSLHHSRSMSSHRHEGGAIEGEIDTSTEDLDMLLNHDEEPDSEEKEAPPKAERERERGQETEGEVIPSSFRLQAEAAARAAEAVLSRAEEGRR